MDNTQVTLTLTVDQVNKVLASLAKMPYEAVADLIGEIRQSAMKQIQETQKPE